jgi:ABC-type Fe3+ transport system permease subunit
MPQRQSFFTRRTKSFMFHVPLPPADSPFVLLLVLLASVLVLVVYISLIYRTLTSPDHNILLALLYTLVLFVLLWPLFLLIKRKQEYLRGKRTEHRDQ